MAFSKILAALVLSVALFEVSSAATVYTVGDNVGWTVGKVNYSLWAETKIFVPGDTIVFHYNKTFHNVLLVTYDHFKTCNVTAPLATFISGHDTFKLTGYGHHFYICGAPGHCQAGQKVDIRVARPSVTPKPSPTPSQAPPTPSPTPTPTPAAPAPSTPASPPATTPTTASPPAITPTPASPPATTPTPASPPPTSESAPAPAPWWPYAPAPAPSAASSLYRSVGAPVVVIASLVAAFAF